MFTSSLGLRSRAGEQSQITILQSRAESSSQSFSSNTWLRVPAPLDLGTKTPSPTNFCRFCSGSKSTKATLNPCSANAPAKCAATVVLPTPPLQVKTPKYIFFIWSSSLFTVLAPPVPITSPVSPSIQSILLSEAIPQCILESWLQDLIKASAGPP